jgi:hypothetical protein
MDNFLNENIKWIGKWIPKQLQPQDIRYVWKSMYEGCNGN